MQQRKQGPIVSERSSAATALVGAIRVVTSVRPHETSVMACRLYCLVSDVIGALAEHPAATDTTRDCTAFS